MRFSANGTTVLDAERLEKDHSDPEIATAIDPFWAKQIAEALEAQHKKEGRTRRVAQEKRK